MRALVLIAMSPIACAHVTPAVSRTSPQHKVAIQQPVALAVETPVETFHHEIEPPPLDVLGWLCQREHMLKSSAGSCEGLSDEDPPRRVPKSLGSVSVSKVRGPPRLDAELVSAAPLIRNCYRRMNDSSGATPSLMLTVLERATSSLLIASVFPEDAPRDLVACVSHALMDELVNPLGSTGPMKIAVTVSPASEAQTPP